MSSTPTANSPVARRFSVLTAGVLLGLSLSACAGKSKGESAPPAGISTLGAPVSEAEAAVLASIPREGTEQTYALADGTTVTVGPIYDSASGRRCRRVDLGTAAEAEHRLACAGAGAGGESEWFFVPVIFPTQVLVPRAPAGASGRSVASGGDPGSDGVEASP